MSLVQMKEVSAGLSAEIRAMIDWKGLLEALFPIGCNFDFTWFAVDLPSTVNQVNHRATLYEAYELPGLYDVEQ